MQTLRKLVLATTNAGKAREMRALLPGVEILTLDDVHFSAPIEEPFDTFADNARVKAQTIFEATGIPALADDSGLCVDALDGAPGVHSARYAGLPQNTSANLTKLLRALQNVEDRRAHFTAAIALCDESGCKVFEGECHGAIARTPSGTGGFGYDPVFVPDGETQTFGSLPAETKKRISHRARAMEKLKASFDAAEFEKPSSQPQKSRKV